jgi:hypothetical protein
LCADFVFGGQQLSPFAQFRGAAFTLSEISGSGFRLERNFGLQLSSGATFWAAAFALSEISGCSVNLERIFGPQLSP